MYSVPTLTSIVATAAFAADRALVRSALNALRYGQPSDFDQSATRRLAHFVECVLASAPSWSAAEGSDLCRIAGEVAELLSSDHRLPQDQLSWLRLRATLLYELGQAPAVASTMLIEEDAPQPILQFFRRHGPFGKLNGHRHSVTIPSAERLSIEWGAVAWDTERAADYLQLHAELFSDFGGSAMSTLAKSLSLPLLATDYSALATAVRRRLDSATRSTIGPELLDALMTLSFPSELWAAQSEALTNGLLSDDVRSWGMAAPTGTGKSFLTQVLITDALLKHPGALLLYLVPSKALVYEVFTRLARSLAKLDLRVTALTPALVNLNHEEEEAIATSSVLVLTPEKADLLVRLRAESFQRTRVAIVDEAHHIESGTRGVLLEMYLWRLKGLIPRHARFVFLSAVAPNIEQLTAWLGAPSRTVLHRSRPTRMRVGVYRIGRLGTRRAGWIDYDTSAPLILFRQRVETTKRRQLVQLAQALAVAGPVLVVAKGKRECEKLAAEMAARLEPPDRMPSEQLQEDDLQRLDSRLERELYPDVLMRELIRVRLFFVEDFSPYSWALLPANASLQWPFRGGRHQAGQRVPASFRQPAEPRQAPNTFGLLPDRRAPFWTFARRSGTVPWEGRQTCDGCDDRIPGTYIRRAPNLRPLHRSPEPSPVRSGRCCLRGCQSPPLVQRSPADERERTRTGTAPAGPGFGSAPG